MSRFQDAVEKSPEIKDAYCAGLQALQAVDRRRVDVQDTQSISGSVNIDGHLSGRYPQDPRWDYAIGYKIVDGKSAFETIYWAEVHPATEGNVNDVLAKLKWLKSWMETQARELRSIQSKFVWIASGKTAISPTSQKRKQMAEAGLTLAGGKLRIRRD